MDKVDKAQVEKNEKSVTEKPVVQTSHRQVPALFLWVMVGVGVLLIALISYGAGYYTERSHSFRNDFGGGMMRGDFNDRRAGGIGRHSRDIMRGSIGEVTAIGADSITIKDTMRGGSVTYKIDDSTKVVENGAAKTVSDIKSGNTVRVTASGADVSVATTIVLGIN